MTKEREEAIKKYWNIAKEKNPFNDETISNGYLEGFIDGATEATKELQKQIEKLDKALITSTKNNIERQKIIDKMKCCHTCDDGSNWKRKIDL